jgi:hypothetical protein
MPVPDWFDFQEPDYDRIFKDRMERIKRLDATPGAWNGLKEYYRDKPADFINDWCVTVDPRNAEIGLPTNVPFLLFPKQEEFINWLYNRWRAREDGLVEKSRDMGLTWLCAAFGVWMWLFYEGTVVGFGSRKEEYVDKLGDPKSIFWKVRQLIRYLPPKLRPEGYIENKDALYMRIGNPVNGAAIVGEAGDNIGRGNRTSLYFKDESAFYERPDSIDAALSQTSNCKIDVSTPNGPANPFYRKRQSGKIPVFTFHWTDDPRKDEKWYRKQQQILDPVILAQEVDIDYNASVEDIWIKGDLITQAEMIGPADVQEFGQWRIGVDAAHMGNDESVIHARKGRLNLEQKILRTADGHQLGSAVEEFCRELESSGSEYIEGIVIELDGPGVSCYDYLRRPGGPYADKVIGVHTGQRLSDNINYNLRALLWRRGRDYFKKGQCSVHKDPEFRAQISSVKYSFRNGLLLMQNKKEYKKETGKSPDRADAFILTFADIVTESVLDEYDHEDFDENRNPISGY